MAIDRESVRESRQRVAKMRAVVKAARAWVRDFESGRRGRTGAAVALIRAVAAYEQVAPDDGE
jgi:hypothetical protein